MFETMAAGDRNKAGKLTTWHFSDFYGVNPLCGFHHWGFMTDNIDVVNCKKCLNLIQKQKLFNNEEPRNYYEN